MRRFFLFLTLKSEIEVIQGHWVNNNKKRTGQL